MTGAAPLGYGHKKAITMADKCRMVQRLFIRNATIEAPEQALWMAVLCNTISDLMPGDRISSYQRQYTTSLQRAAAEFFTARRHVIFCDWLGLDADWVLEILRDQAGLEVISCCQQV